MTEQITWLELIGQAMRAFGPLYQDSMRQAIQDSGAPEHWFLLSMAHGSDPQPFSVERMQEIGPYTKPTLHRERLEYLAQLEMLERAGEDAYRLTGMGRKAVANIFVQAHKGLDKVLPLPAEDMDQLNHLLGRLVQATLEAPEPRSKWCIAYSRWTDPGEAASPSVKTDQYLTDLLRYRDDAHLAAWQSYGISGPAWEALTFIWRGDAGTAEELAEKLPYRNFTAEDYGQYLAELVERGWLVEQDGDYQATAEGRKIREQAEKATDRYFEAPWATLSEQEQQRLHQLLLQLRDKLQEMPDADAA